MATPRLVLLTGALTGLLLGCSLIWRTSSAAFLDSTSVPPTLWSAGHVTLTDNHAGQALFSVTGLQPGATGQRCVQVGYTGSLAADVRLHAGAGAQTTLAPYLEVVVEEGAGTSPDCTDFAATSTLLGAPGFTPGVTAQTLLDQHGSYACGLSTWRTPAGPDARAYRISYRLKDHPDSQGRVLDVSPVWEARNA